ncbi:MAG: elongation factor P [Chlamydiota bacterium]
MSQASTNEVKAGMKVEIENEPYVVINNDFVKPGKGQAFNKMRVKNILNGKVIEKTFKSGDKLDLADVEEAPMRLLYVQGDDAIFMNDTSFEQISVPLSSFEEKKQWLMDDIVYVILFYKSSVIDVTPPTFMVMKITETSPGLRGDTSGRVLKAATLQTGAKIQVPIFINEGETIKVDTRTGEYVSRV